jgi:hypothetical protein
VCCPAGVDEPDEEDAAELPPGSEGWLLNRPAVPGETSRPVSWPETLLEVPVADGVPPPPTAPLLTSFDDEVEEESCGTKAAAPCRNPGHTNPSNVSTTSNPAPAAIEARRAMIAVAVFAGAASLPAPGRAGGRRTGAPARGRADSGRWRESSMTCSVSSASARMGSSSGAHRAMRSSRRLRQVSHWPTWRATANRMAVGNTTLSRRTPSGAPPSRSAAASICRSSPHPGASSPSRSGPASAASAVTSKARSIACRFSRRNRRTSATSLPSSHAAFRLSSPLATNRPYCSCRDSGSVATIWSSQCRSDACLANELCVSGPSAATWACTAAQSMSSILAGSPDVSPS